MSSTVAADKARRLVERQLKKAGLVDSDDPRIRSFVDLVHESYREFDRHRRLTDHSTRLASEELAETIASLGASERLFRSLARSSPNGIMYADAEGRCLYLNEQAERLLEQPADQLIGDGWLRALGQRERLSVAKAAQSCEAGEDMATIEHRLDRVDGRSTWLSTTIAPVDDPDQRTGVTGWVAIIEDITERKRFEREMSNLALRDSLTGLENRYSLGQQLDERCNRLGAGDRLAVAVLDLDRFKMVNDTFGHDAGDLLLVGVAQKLLDAASPGDIVARLGGDEFAFVRSLAPGEAPEHLGRHLSSAVHGPIECDGRTLHVGGSVGVAVSRPSDTPADLLRNADVAMYRAKRSSVLTSQVYDDSFRNDAASRFDLEADVRAAVAENSFAMVYQPIVDTSTRQIVAVEAFARLDHQRLGAVPPATFVSVAEDLGIMPALGEQLLDQACRDVQIWRGADAGVANVMLSVNISTLQLADPTFPDAVDRVLTRHGLGHGDLMLEITERAFGSYADQTVETLETLRSAGALVAIDDFGTGYSSLANLDRLPVDFVKIDESFIANIGGEDASERLTGAIIDLAMRLGLTPIAEGVETEAQRTMLLDAGCPLMQGHLVARPMPPADAQLIKLLGLEPS